jgi:hypothetical protein
MVEVFKKTSSTGGGCHSCVQTSDQDRLIVIPLDETNRTPELVREVTERVLRIAGRLGTMADSH